MCVCGGEKRGTGVGRVKKDGEECESWMGFCQRRTSHAKPDVYVTLCYCCWFGSFGGLFYVGEGETGVTRYRWSAYAYAGCVVYCGVVLHCR